jgi:histone deacetylase 1/2
MPLVYVDDLVSIGWTIMDIKQEKKQLSGIFKMKDLGELSYVLGIRVTRNADGSIELDQEELIKRTS